MGKTGAFQFLIFCQDKEDVTRIKSDISMQPGCVVETSENSEWTMQKIASGQVQCLLFNCQFFNLGSLNTLAKLRGYKTRIPIIVITDKLEKEVLEYNRKLQHVVIVERKNYNYGIMFDLCTKVRLGKPVYRRAHERFITSQPVSIERLTDHLMLSGTMRNMSRGGAFLDVKGTLKEGDILKVSVELPEVKKAHVVFGEVVRLLADNYPKGECGVGIRYISPQDLYSALLERV